MNNICKHHKNLIESKKIVLILGDGRLGYKNRAPYKFIHIETASREVPKDIIEELDL